MVRLAIARLRFCSNSFTPRRTRNEDVQAHEWSDGSAAFETSQAQTGELDGVRRFAAAHPDWSITALRCASAPTGGPLSAGLFSAWMTEVDDSLRRGRFDAVYLSLHGACQAEGDPAVDVTILRRVRSIMGPRPVVASFDRTANLSEEIALLLDGASSNRLDEQNSEAKAALRALAMLEGIVAGTCRPVGALARLPHVVGQDVMDQAMRRLQDSEQLALGGPLLDMSLFSGFVWGDSPYTGPSALVWADRDAGTARGKAAQLALSLARMSRAEPAATLPVERAIRAAATSLSTPLSQGLSASSVRLQPDQGVRSGAVRPVLLLDPSDDPLAGGLTDTPEMLRSLQRAQAFGHLPGRTVLATLHDTDSVHVAQETGLGKSVSLNLCGLTTRLYGASVPVAAQVHSLGESPETGRFCILRSGLLDVIVTTKRVEHITPSLLSRICPDFADARLLAVKGGRLTAAAFENVVSASLSCDCAGPASQDLLRLPYNFVPSIRRASAADDGQGFNSRGDDEINANHARRFEERRTRGPQVRGATSDASHV